jgi:hypothetical protein
MRGTSTLPSAEPRPRRTKSSTAGRLPLGRAHEVERRAIVESEAQMMPTSHEWLLERDACFGAGSRDRRRRESPRYSATKASRSALMVSASVVGMPWGKPLYVFKVPFFSSFADNGAESAYGTI